MGRDATAGAGTDDNHVIGLGGCFNLGHSLLADIMAHKLLPSVGRLGSGLNEREESEIAETGADQRAGYYIAEEVHTQQNARHTDTQGAEE